jgi:hypothetical protein
VSDSATDADAVIADLNARMTASLLILPMQLGPEPLICPACGRTRMACVQFYGHDRQHDEDIRRCLREGDPVRMPFEKLMEHAATLSEADQALPMGKLAERWGEPVQRVADAICAVRVTDGERTYITIGDRAEADFKRLFALQGQARDLGRGIITCGGYAGRSHYGAVIATYPEGSRIANRDSWRCHHDHPDDVSALECALAEVQRLAGKGRFDFGAPQPTTSYEPCSAGPDCRDEFCRRDWARLVQ